VGGSIGLTLRVQEGEEYRMTRWTNILPWALTNLQLLEKNPVHTEVLLRRWLEMRADWEANCETGEFAFPMTSTYFPTDGLVPVEYGLIVVDFVRNVILTNQGYTSVGGFYLISGEDRHRDVAREMSDPYNPENESELSRFGRLWKAGKIRSRQVWNGKAYVEIPVEPEPWEGIFDALHEGPEDGFDSYFYLVDMSPFTVEKYEPDTEGWTAMKARILELGFALTPEEEAGWTAWFARLAEQEAEDR